MLNILKSKHIYTKQTTWRIMKFSIDILECYLLQNMTSCISIYINGKRYYLVVLGILTRNNVINTIKVWFSTLFLHRDTSKATLIDSADDELSLRIISFVITAGHYYSRYFCCGTTLTVMRGKCYVRLTYLTNTSMSKKYINHGSIRCRVARSNNRR